MRNNLTSNSSHAQTGMVLLLCLIFLTALTLLGLSAAADTILQNQISSNQHESERGKQSALAALSWAENWLLALDGHAPEVCTSACEGLYLHDTGSLPPHPEFEPVDWWISQGHRAGVNPLTGELSTIITGGGKLPPVWIIEMLHFIPAEQNPAGQVRVWYRILARGSGRSEAAISVIESIVVKSWPASVAAGSTAAANSEICFEYSRKCSRVAWRELR